MPRWTSDDPVYDPREATEPEKEPTTAAEVARGLLSIFTLGLIGGSPKKSDDDDSGSNDSGSSSIDSMMNW